MIVTIDNNEYEVQDTEFTLKEPIQELENLKILNDVSRYELLYGLISDLCDDFSLKKFNHINPSHGGFLLCKLFNENKTINLNYLFNYKVINENNIENCLTNFKKYNINFNDDNNSNLEKSIILIEEISNLCNIETIKLNLNSIYLSEELKILDEYYDNKIKVTKLNLYLYFSNEYRELFQSNYWYYFKGPEGPEGPERPEGPEGQKGPELDYNNLINLCIMVKNGGDTFKQVLEENLKYIDKWTILDTGSTDDTISVINDVLVNKKKGNLYTEPFINFRDSRNRLIELAGNTCKYIIMIDDTYIIKQDLRKFLETIRGDQYGTSYAFYIKSYDNEYTSNRVIKSNSGLKYIYRIHEVITPENNVNVIIPIHFSHIIDINSKYMEKRTNDRKLFDLELLQQELEDDPDNPRTYYYFATTYSCIEKFEEAFDWFIKRVEHNNEGFIQEKVDACFEAARLADFKLNKPWEEVKQLYEKAHLLSPDRPDSLYFLGVHYYMNNDHITSYNYFKQAYNIGYPYHCQYSLKPTLSFKYCPKLLCFSCWHVGDYLLGEEASNFYLNNGMNTLDNDEEYKLVVSWNKIFKNLNSSSVKANITEIKNLNYLNKPTVCFYYNESSQNRIFENFIINLSNNISNLYNIFIFHNGENKNYRILNNITYLDLSLFNNFIYNNLVLHCFICNELEMLANVNNSYVENTHVILNDRDLHLNVISNNYKLKNIICLNSVQYKVFNDLYEQFNNISSLFEDHSNYLSFINNYMNNNIIKLNNDFEWLNINFITKNILNSLNLCNVPNILDVSNNTGESIINILKLINKCKCYCVNTSDINYHSIINYNLNISNLYNKINLFYENSNEILSDFLNNNMIFNFIHLDCSCTKNDFYTNLFACFNMLHLDGILLLSNYKNSVNIINKLINSNTNINVINDDKFIIITTKKIS